MNENKRKMESQALTEQSSQPLIQNDINNQITNNGNLNLKKNNQENSENKQKNASQKMQIILILHQCAPSSDES